MFLDEETINVPYEQEPHETHDMGEWRSTVCQLSNNDRFGRVRRCSICGGRDYLCGGAGSRWQDRELLKPCSAMEITLDGKERKIHLTMDENGISMADCDRFGTPECDDCQYRFKCYTQRKLSGRLKIGMPLKSIMDLMNLEIHKSEDNG